MNTSPCRNCSKRKYLCHSSCEEYIEFKKVKDNITKKKKEEQIAKNASIESVYRYHKAIRNGRTLRKRSI